jgi:phosphoenolpyruvate carboxykinase (diphosphate)
MDFLSSLTGKSPSTTGFGSEGALTKGPFNALWPVVDMNNALVSAILTGYAGFTSVAGYIGPRYKVDHDVSMLVPELWCRMSVQERDPAYLIEHGYLERIADFDHEGRRVLGSRLGFRITRRFVEHFLGRMFQTPNAVFTEDMLRPELQGLEPFVAGVDALVATQTRVAKSYFDDGSVNGACPPLRALLHVMVHGHYEGMSASDLRFRELFTRESLLASEWYRERLLTKQRRDIALWRRHEAALDEASNLRRQRPRLFCERLEVVEQELARVSSGDYLVELTGTLGADPFAHQEHAGQRYASAAE